MHRIVLAACAVTVLAACQPASIELTDYQKGEIAAEVELINGQFWEAWRAVDVERGMSYYLNSPDFTVALDGQLVHGYAEFDNLARSLFANIASQSITVRESQTTVMAPDVVCVIERLAYTQTDNAGATGPEYTAAFTSMWVRRDAEWKVHHFHNSSPTPEEP